MMQSNNLSVCALDKWFRQGNTEIHVLDHVSISFEQGGTYAIMGTSGSGKSTFMQLLAGLDMPTSGSIRYNQQDLTLLSPAQRNLFQNQKIGLVWQQPYVIRELSVRENVMVPGLIAGKNAEECAERALELLQAVGIADKADHKPASLSGGQQQRLVLARALFNRPAFLLADEPTGSLDSETGKKIVALLLTLRTQYHMGIIISTHDRYVADNMQEKYLLEQGKLKRL